MIRFLATTTFVMMLLLHASSSGAQSIESLVMPGDVVESHADIESESSSCHVMFNREAQTQLCVDCHEDVGADIGNARGFHGRSADAGTETCASCHTDHEGRDAQIVLLDESSFDHDLTDFALIGGHLDIGCADCHAPEEKYRDAPSDCLSCHVEDDPHQGFMGEQCVDCHTASGWLEVEFDHETTDYPLIGGHREPACADCHVDQTFQDTPSTCIGCHADDDVHNGRSGDQCDSCHNPTSWTDSSFDHARDTRFTLDGRHGELTCSDCHSDEPFADALDTTCISCHLEEDEHDGHFGAECETCHTTELWTEIAFDHERDTNHALLGAHETLDCESCHVQPVFDVAIGPGCNDCHAEDDPHDGEQGIECLDCHNESSWEEDVFFDHDLTSFPLLGGHAEAECESCHESHRFRDAPGTCVDCHAEEDPHNGRYSSDCADCHNPVDWQAWQFDHDALTDFPLDGAHDTVACDACHRQPLQDMQQLGSSCGDCHRADDIHDGEFGADCGRCHSADNFRDVRNIQ